MVFEALTLYYCCGNIVELHVSGGCNDSWCCDFGTLYYCRPEAPGESTQSSYLRYTLGHCCGNAVGMLL